MTKNINHKKEREIIIHNNSNSYFNTVIYISIWSNVITHVLNLLIAFVFITQNFIYTKIELIIN